MATPLVVVTEPIDAECEAWLRERCEVVECAVEDGGFEGLLARAEGLIVRTYTVVDEGLLKRAARLRVVGRAGVGIDNIDAAACRRRGIAVVNTPEANADAVAEFVWACVFDAMRPRLFLDRALSAERWHRVREELIAERQLSDLTLGVWGMGRIGRRVARIGAALGMRVVYYDIVEIEAGAREGAAPMERDMLLAESHIISLHVDGRAENRNMVGTRELNRMREDVLLINAARGFIVDAAALAAFLRERPEAQAVLDVHEPEPFGPEHPLVDVKNAHLSPHIAAATRTAKKNMSWVVRDVWAALSGAGSR
ncbi:MAG: NAD(P)-dependent oxidoreductase [Planctomycetota bacterium]|nr:NAD(P)-dependent oxidoreductase [Planctomycetota bacterium]